MAGHIQLGQRGEQWAADFLIGKGFVILHRNWRYSHYEIDIIAIHKDVLHFVEVKIRSSKKWGLPEEAVTKKKFERLLQAADEFLFQHPQYRHVQYDIVAINTAKNSEPQIFFIEDVYM